MLATLLVVCLVYDSPAVHPRVEAEEKQFLLSFQLQSESKVKQFERQNRIRLNRAKFSKFVEHENNIFFCRLTETEATSYPMGKDASIDSRLVCCHNKFFFLRCGKRNSSQPTNLCQRRLGFHSY